MRLHWSTVNDDELRLVDKTVEFLQGEFCPPGADPMWSSEYFHWKLGDVNPAGKGYISLAVIDDRVVGTVSLTRKRLWINGRECVGGEVGDSYSSSAVRRKSRPIDLSPLDSDPNSYLNKSIFGRLASDVRSRAEAAGVSIIYGTPNKNAYPGWVDRLGYFDWKEYGNRSFSRPTSRLIARKYPVTKSIAILLRGLDGSYMRLRKMVCMRSVARRLIFETRSPALAELGELWERLKPACGFCLVRDAAYWRHRYLEHPLAKYVLLGIRDSGRLVGVVATRLSSIEAGRRVVSIVEWMVEDHVPFAYVLSEVFEHYKDTEAEVFNFWADDRGSEAKAARMSLFFSRNRAPIVVADTPQGRSLQMLAANTKFYLGSADAV